LNTDEAYIIEKNAVMIALGYTFVRESSRERENDFTIDLGYGILERLEITADFPVIFLNPREGSYAKGIGDIAGRLEYALLEETPVWPDSSTALIIKIPSGNEEEDLGSGGTDYAISQQFSKTFNRPALHANVGYTFVEGGDNTIFLASAFEYELPPIVDLKVVGEIWGEVPPASAADDSIYEMLFGLIYKLSPHCNLDFGAGYGLKSPSAQCRLTTGVAFEF
jgi:hypothetical protein